MEIVCPAWCPQAENMVKAIPLLANQGVTAIEVWIDHPDYLNVEDEFELEGLVASLGECGVRVHSVHSPFGIECDVSSLDDKIHERGVDGLIASIEVANMLGAGKVIVHASHSLNGTVNGRFERARGVLREMTGLARESGIVLALENLPPGYLGHTPDEMLDLLDGLDRESIGICFDSGHANLSGHFHEFAAALLPRSVTMHLHDNDGKTDEHRFPGEGTIDWRAFGSLCHKAGAGASMMLECKPPEGVVWFEAFQRLRLALGE